MANLAVLHARRTLAVISLASLGWAFSFGLGALLSPLWLEDAGLSAWTIGLNTSIYYLGVACASPLVPRLMPRGNRACVITGMCLDALTTAAFPWVSGVAAWHTLRFLGGVGTALSIIPMETLVNQTSPPESRARDFGIYAFCVATGIGLGSVVGLPIYPVAPRLAFALGGLVTLLAIVLARMGTPSRYLVEDQPGAGTMRWGDGLLSLGTAWAQGFLEGGTITFLSLYLLHLGYSEAGISGLMGGLFAGVVVAQLPLAWLADRVGRLRILLLCHALLLLGMLCIPRAQAMLPLAGWLILLGACCGALYPLGLALLGDRLPTASLARANAWYLASNCAGSLSGPLILGVAIDRFGLSAQFPIGAAAVLAVVVSGLLASRRIDRAGESAVSSVPRRAA